MFIIICLVFTLSNSLATEDVTVYEFSEYYGTKPGTQPQPFVVSQLPWKYSYRSNDWISFRIIWKNKSPIVTTMKVLCQSDYGTVDAKKYNVDDDYYSVRASNRSTEFNITLNLYTLNMLCASLPVAEGRFSTGTNEALNKKFKYYARCLGYGCVLQVDLKNKCVGPPLATRTTDTNKVKPCTDGNEYNITNTSRPQDTIETTTRKIAANSTNADNTNFTIIIIATISSISGTLLILLVMIAIWKRSWFKRRPSGTPQLPTNEPNPDPFYLNMLFRRECDQEIAEIDEHQYEEIGPQVTEGR